MRAIANKKRRAKEGESGNGTGERLDDGSEVEREDGREVVEGAEDESWLLCCPHPAKRGE